MRSLLIFKIVSNGDNILYNLKINVENIQNIAVLKIMYWQLQGGLLWFLYQIKNNPAHHRRPDVYPVRRFHSTDRNPRIYYTTDSVNAGNKRKEERSLGYFEYSDNPFVSIWGRQSLKNPTRKPFSFQLIIQHTERSNEDRNHFKKVYQSGSSYWKWRSAAAKYRRRRETKDIPEEEDRESRKALQTRCETLFCGKRISPIQI